jgi:L-2-hydroxyglutarate oxidase LhgO
MDKQDHAVQTELTIDLCLSNREETYKWTRCHNTSRIATLFMIVSTMSEELKHIYKDIYTVVSHDDWYF